MDPERIRTQLKKTLDTPFEVVSLNVDTQSDFNCPVSFINELRRENIKLLEEKITKKFKRSPDYGVEPITAKEGKWYGKTHVMYTYPSIRLDPDMLEPGADIYCLSLYDMAIPAVRKKAVEFIREKNTAKFCLMLPDFYHDRLKKVIDETVKALKQDMGDAFDSIMTSQLFEDKNKYSDLGLKKYVSAGANIYSMDSLKASTEYCDGLFMSHELSPEEIDQCASALKDTGTALMVHAEGLIPWMQSDFCCCGQNAKDCNFCERQSVFALNGISSEETKCLAIPHRSDCSCTIYGPARNLWTDMDYPDCDIITNRTIIPKGERYG